MWAQIIKARLKQGAEAEMQQLMGEIEGATQRSPFVGSTVLQNQNDPSEYYNIVLFESEEAARANENTPEQQDRVRRIQGLYDGPPEFVNCNVVHETPR
jgi:heme-degrading monooxygenase HmoA